MSDRRRLDAELVRRKIARSREQAVELIRGGQVLVQGMPAIKPATQVSSGVSIQVLVFLFSPSPLPLSSSFSLLPSSPSSPPPPSSFPSLLTSSLLFVSLYTHVFPPRPGHVPGLWAFL